MTGERLGAGVLPWLVTGLVLAGLVVLAPLATPIILAAWAGEMLRPLAGRLAKRLQGRGRMAAVVVSALVVIVVVPFVIAGVSLASGTVELYHLLVGSQSVRESLVALVQGGEPAPSDAGAVAELTWSAEQVFALVREHGGRAWSVLTTVAGATTSAFLAIFVFLFTLYAMLSNRSEASAWLYRHVPLRDSDARRLAAAFFETGRGLVIGQGLTAVSQGVIALIAFMALGVPRSVVLGLLTGVAALVPVFGPALVWVPVAIGLALADRMAAAAVMAGIGMLVIGSVDNVARPLFARYADLDLPTIVLVASLFGGITVFGASGLVLGPLLVRLAIEALRLWREEVVRRPDAP